MPQTTYESNGVYRVKITGETVQVVGFEENGRTRCLRARQSRDGVEYEEVLLGGDALETVHESIQREWSEVKFRHKLSSEPEEEVEAKSAEKQRCN